jgi:chaperone modulatory protein CbpM
MASLDDILTRFQLTHAEVTMWVEEGWIEPDREGDAFVFDEADVARIGLIVDLRRDLEIDESAMPVVLSLLDQLHAARAALKRITAAIAELPPEFRERLSAVLGEHATDSEESDERA